MARGESSKSVLRSVHRWLGLTLGILFAVAGVSGSLLLFQPQLFRWAHGELIPAGLPQDVGSIDRWVENARAAVPDLQGPFAIWPPQVDHNVSDAGMLVFSGNEPGGFGDTGFAGVLVAPTSGEVLGVIDIDRSAAYAPLFLHRHLWAGDAGRAVVGITGLAVVALVLIGFYLWWPGRAAAFQKLSPRPWRATLQRAAPLHRWAGIWMLPILFVLAGTGVFLAQPTWVIPALDALLGPQANSGRASEGLTAASACAGPIGFDDALARAQTLVPAGRLVRIAPLRGKALHRWQIDLRTDSEALFRQTRVIADLKCGRVAVEETPVTRTRRASASLWLASLHDGTAFGTTGKILVSFAGLIPLLLAWSGVRMWLRGRSVRAQRRKVQLDSPAQDST